MSVRCEIHDHVARVTIDRPEVRNAVDAATERALQEIWVRIESDPSVRVVVLTGSGDAAFSAGADMKASSPEDAASGLEYWAKPRPGEEPAAAAARAEAFFAEWRAVQADPDSISKFWMGHPHRRWSTFLKHSVVGELSGRVAS